MSMHYFSNSFRNLRRNRMYTVLNIAGLSVGIACTLFILLWVSDEMSYDGFHANKKELYQLWSNEKLDQGIQSSPAMSLPLEKEIREKVAGIKYVIPVDWGFQHLLSYGDKKLRKKSYYAGEHFLDMFSFPLRSGSSKMALSDPNNVLITQSLANALFAKDDPMGKVIEMDNKVSLKVSGVLEDVPANSTFQFDFLVPFSNYIANNGWVKNAESQWDNRSFRLFMQLEPNVSASQVERAITQAATVNNSFKQTQLFLHPMDKWHLYAEFKNGQSSGGLIVYVRIFSLIALFIIVIACINFINLATAGAAGRAKEVGIKKTLGAERKTLVKQFLSESFLLTLCSFLLAVLIVQLLLPVFNGLVHKKLSIDFSNPVYWLVAAGTVITVSLLSGAYPAFYLSSFNPLRVFKQNVAVGRNTIVPRKILVVLQFSFAIILIICTTVIYTQIQHVKNRDTGYNPGSLVMIQPNDALGKSFPVIKSELLKTGVVSSITKASSPVTDVYEYANDISWEGKTGTGKTSFATLVASYDYTKTVGAVMLEGRDFSAAYASDSSGVIVNETAAKLMGTASVLGKKVMMEDEVYTVIGIMKDILMTSPYKAVDPTIVRLDPGWASNVLVRLQPGADLITSLGSIKAIYDTYCGAYPFEYKFADQEFERKFSSQELTGKLSNIFAALSIFISCLGLFGLAAFACTQKRKEIGIRKVLGASVTGIVSLLTKDFLVLVLIAFLIASPIGWVFMHSWLQDFTYRTTISGWVFVMAGTTAVVIAVVTVSFQAIRAAAANPVKSLRTE